MALPFVPGYPPGAPRLLDRFLPPLADGVAAHYIQKHTRPGDLVFDPFGQAPAVAVEALALNRRVVVASFNPVSRLALSLAVRPPAIAALRAALTVLADVPTGTGPADRLELAVKSLYRTRCTECDTPTTADVLDWDGEANQPVAKLYYCAQCGGQRHSPVDADDLALAGRYRRGGLDYHFLLERVTTAADPDRSHAEEALSVYTPRTLAAIGAVLVKVEALSRDRETKRLLAGLLVAALDETTVLGQDRPKLLTVPRRYREANFWLALERAVGLLAGQPQPERAAPLAAVLAEAAEPRIHAYSGNVRELGGLLPARSVPLMLTAVPRPTQAYWSLSAVWSAWLWGRDSAADIRGVLRRRRYDWAWHAKALQRTLAPLIHTLPAAGRLVSLVPESEPGFNAALLAAASGAGFALDDAVLRADTSEAQFEWRAIGPGSGPASPHEITLKQALRDGAVACLRGRAEPTRWVSLHLAAWRRPARLRLLAWQPDEPLAAINSELDSVAADTTIFARHDAAPDSEPATGAWSLAALNDLAGAPAPLADRVELSVAELLSPGTPLDEYELHAAVCRALPGAQTPGRALVAACLSSYAVQQDNGLWQLRPEDVPAKRQEQQQAMEAALLRLGRQCGFQVRPGAPQEWLDGERVAYRFVIGAAATLGLYAQAGQGRAARCVVVLPGGRAGLAEFKLRRDARLRVLFESGPWLILKYRQAWRLVADRSITAATLDAALAGDPLDNQQQLSLLA